MSVEYRISVVVPVYNVAQYLEMCIESIRQQTYSYMEIILVDDGSTDESGMICDKFAKEDERIKVIHKSNEGVSVARNVGMELSTGQFLCFVDSDDLLPMDSIEKLIYHALESNSDLCCGAWTKIGVKKIEKNSYEPENIDVSDKEKLMNYLFIEEVNGPVAKLYKTTIINENGLKFMPGIKIGEDAIFNFQYIQHCVKVSLIPNTVYYYNKLNTESVTHTYYSDFNKCSLMCAIEQSKNILSDIYEFNSLWVQQIFCSRFVACVDYLSYYGLPEEIFVNELNKTYEMFKLYLNANITNTDTDCLLVRAKNIISDCEKKQWHKLYIDNNKNIHVSIKQRMKQKVYQLISQYKIRQLLKGRLKL